MALFTYATFYIQDPSAVSVLSAKIATGISVLYQSIYLPNPSNTSRM